MTTPNVVVHDNNNTQTMTTIGSQTINVPTTSTSTSTPKSPTTCPIEKWLRKNLKQNDPFIIPKLNYLLRKIQSYLQNPMVLPDFPRYIIMRKLIKDYLLIILKGQSNNSQKKFNWPA
eukprot:307283_1